MLSDFWDVWREVEGSHEVFSSGKPLNSVIPFFTHGDEGATLRQLPFMVQSWQPVISWLGPGSTSVSGLPDSNDENR